MLIFLSLIFSCTKYVPVVTDPPEPDPPPESIPSTFDPLLFETNKFKIWVHNNGYVSQGEPSYPNDDMSGVIYGFGFWAAGYQDGLYYYENTRDAATNFFMDRLPKETYVFEYPLRVTHTKEISQTV